MSNVSFSNPFYLLVFIPLVIIVIIGYFLIDKKSRKLPKNIISLALHLIICVLISLSAADFSYLNTASQTDLYVLADVSSSNEENIDLMDSYINQISAFCDNGTKMGLICYGKNFEVLTSLGGRIRSVKQSVVDKTATDLEGALRYTNSLFNSDSVKRIILISDSSQTDNNALNALDDLIKNNVYIDAIYLNNILDGYEAQINNVYYSKSVYLNQEDELKVSIQSSSNTSSKISLYCNNSEVKVLDVRLTKGINIINFPLDSSNKGIFNYEVRLEATLDTIQENNIMKFQQEVASKINVLLVSETTTDYLEINKLYSNLYGEDNYQIDPYIGSDASLGKTIQETPYSIVELCKYDEIVLSNINISQINKADEFTSSLNDFVSFYGKSLLTFGATYSTGTDYMSKYNGLLPVQFEQSDAKALTIIVDSSYSMETDDRLKMAKEGAKACLDLLNEKDYVSIISFATDAKVIQPLTSINNKEEIIKAIDTISLDSSNSIFVGASASTNFNVGLNAAYSQLRNINIDDKQILFLTDGQPNDSEENIYKTLNNMKKDNIITSFINISCREGEDLLKDLIAVSGGTYYYVNQASEIVKIILTSVADKVANTKIEGDFNINIKEKNDYTIKDITSLSHILGYNYSRIKSSANTVLTVTYTNEEGGTREVPLYAYWSYGKGKVSCFTSNIGDNWTKEFRRSASGKQFLMNVVSNSLPLERNGSVFDTNIINNGFTSNINISISNNNDNGFVKVKVTSPSGQEEEKYLEYKNSLFSGVFTTNEVGLYKMNISYTSINVQVEDEQNFYFSYSKEYDKFTTKDESLLYKLTKDRGKVTDKVDYVLNNEEIINRSEHSLIIEFLITSIILFIIDIAIRKINFKSIIRKHNKNI